MNLKSSIAILAIWVALGSCIREDRSKCPCYLHVDLTQVDTHYVHKMDLMLSEIGGSTEWYPVRKSAIGDTLIMAVNKSEFDFYAWGNLVYSLKDDSRQTISATERGDSLWSYRNRIYTRCEDAYVRVIADRQYIPVTIIVRGMLQNISSIHPELENISSELFYDGVATGVPAPLVPTLISTPEGNVQYYLYKTMILTQTSPTAAVLRLEFVRDGQRVMASYPVGEMLSEMGEDISQVNQNPIILDLTIGAASVFLAIRVNDWCNHGVFTITY